MPHPEQAAGLIEVAQPFRTGKRALWMLHEVSNFDKHRTLHLTGYAIHSSELTFQGLAPNTQVVATARVGPAESQAPFLTLSFPGIHWPLAGSPDDVKVKGPMTMGIVFDEGNPAAGALVTPTLGAIARHAYEIVKGIASDVLALDL